MTIPPTFKQIGNGSRYKACLKLWKEGEELDDTVEEVIRHRRLVLGIAAAREAESGSHRIVNVDNVVGQGPRGGSLYQFQILYGRVEITAFIFVNLKGEGTMPRDF